MEPYEHMNIVLNQIEDFFNKPRKPMRDSVLIDLDREEARRENEEILEEKAQFFYNEELQAFLNSSPDILEALGEQTPDFIKGLLKHPEILKACETYFHFMVMEESRKRARE